MTENGLLCEQIHKLRKEKLTTAAAPANEGKLVAIEVLRKNHDTILEKYEMYRQRNEVLEQ